LPPTPRDIHRRSTQLFSSIMVVLGVVMIVVTISGGGGAISLGVLLGLLFIAAGCGRLYIGR
jgi:hypothetical protein